MKIIISPAKSLDFESAIPKVNTTTAAFLDKSAQINKALVKKSPKKLAELMGISAQLAELNWQRNQDFSLPFTNENARAAIYAFSGDVYQGLEVKTLSSTALENLQRQCFILSGLYGYLRPFDLMQPYRLEMGTKFAPGRSKNLYEFWKKTLTDSLNQSFEEDDCLVNLASNEYSSAVDFKKISVPIYTPVFKDWKDDKLKIISFFAKKARGLMLRYIVENNIDHPKDLLGFNLEGYTYSEVETKDHFQPVFIR